VGSWSHARAALRARPSTVAAWNIPPSPLVQPGVLAWGGAAEGLDNYGTVHVTWNCFTTVLRLWLDFAGNEIQPLDSFDHEFTATVKIAVAALIGLFEMQAKCLPIHAFLSEASVRRRNKKCVFSHAYLSIRKSPQVKPC